MDLHIIPYTRRAFYYETDRMGIVHHSNYLRYFEEARLDFMRQANCSARELEEQGVIIPNVDASAKYLRPIRFEDMFTVHVHPAEWTGVRMRFTYEVESRGELCCTGTTTHCFVRQDSMKPVVLQRLHPDFCERLSHIFAR